MTRLPRLTAFPTAARFRAWLTRHHASESELLVRCYKVGASARGMTYSEALDAALCFGWIDGVRRAVDGESFSVRFSPRKPRSIWSRVNIRRMRELEAEDRVAPAGQAAFRARDPARSGVYSFESRPASLPPVFEKKFRAQRAAWRHFQAQPPWYRRTATFWVVSAKREETRARRLGVLIASSARGMPIAQLDRTPRTGAATLPATPATKPTRRPAKR